MTFRKESFQLDPKLTDPLTVLGWLKVVIIEGNHRFLDNRHVVGFDLIGNAFQSRIQIVVCHFHA